MKTIFKDNSYDRVDNQTADLRVKSGWKYVPKSEWKKNDRDFEKAERKKAKETKENN